MPPKKGSAFAQLAKKAKGSSVPKAVPGSAYETIRRKNEYRRTGIKRSYNDADGGDDPVLLPSSKKTKTAKATRYAGSLATAVRNYGGGTAGLQRPMKVTNPRPARPDPSDTQPDLEPNIEPIETWRPAGGEQSTESSKKDQSPTETLGLARLSTWRVKIFEEDVVKLMKETGGGVPELRVEQMMHGGESVSDVWAVFEDAVQADL
ncbi:hypothetical protein EJ03DRAFT_384002, partial [Teratosphaeria nubilosa]